MSQAAKLKLAAKNKKNAAKAKPLAKPPIAKKPAAVDSTLRKWFPGAQLDDQWGKTTQELFKALTDECLELAKEVYENIKVGKWCVSFMRDHHASRVQVHLIGNGSFYVTKVSEENSVHAPCPRNTQFGVHVLNQTGRRTLEGRFTSIYIPVRR